MKKKLLPGIVALAVLLIAGLGMNRSMASYGDLSDVALQNVLALADGENPENPDPGEDDDDKDKDYEFVVPYENTVVTLIGNRIFVCSYGGVDCLGTGDVDCDPVFYMDCDPA